MTTLSAPVEVESTGELSVARTRAFGTDATLVLYEPPDGSSHSASRNLLDRAAGWLDDYLTTVDRACSRFRTDSEVWGACEPGGRWVRVSPLLFEAVSVAREVAEKTGGAVDPTVGRSVERIGYDRDFGEVRRRGHSYGPEDFEDGEEAGAGWPKGVVAARKADERVPAPGWWTIELDPRSSSIKVPAGALLDLGSTAKAWAADRAAGSLAEMTSAGALVSLGGDVAVAGPVPENGWPVAVAMESSVSRKDASTGPVVSLRHGGLASSSTVVRSWPWWGRRAHHIVDPRTGNVASTHWALVTVAAGSCVDANAASTAAIVWGEDAAARLRQAGLPARLVRHDGLVVVVAGWPHDKDGAAG